MFTAKDVVNAYEITGLTPIYGAFFERNFTCACALSAMYAAKKNPMNPQTALKELDATESDNFNKEIIEVLGIELGEKSVDDFVGNFWRGYDRDTKTTRELQENLKFGAEIRKGVEKLLGREVPNVTSIRSEDE